MGKFYRVKKTTGNGKANLSEALKVTESDTLEVPQEALFLNIESGVKIEKGGTNGKK